MVHGTPTNASAARVATNFVAHMTTMSARAHAEPPADGARQFLSLDMAASLFTVLLLSTVVTAAEVHIFIQGRDAVAESIRASVGEAADLAAVLAVPDTAAAQAALQRSRDVLAQLDDVRQARYGYDAYAAMLCISIGLLAAIVYLTDRENINRQAHMIGVFVCVSSAMLVQLQLYLRDSVLSKMSKPSEADVRRAVKEECARRVAES